MASPPLIAALACLVVLYSRREPTAAPDNREPARPQLLVLLRSGIVS
jgi:hypothetical protein